MIASDCDAYDAMISCLAATRLFGTVLLDEADRAQATPHAAPLAIITPGPWTESMTDDPDRLVRRVSYRVTIRARADDPRARLLELDRLAREVSTRLNRADFGPGCVPRLSTIHRGEPRISPGSGEARCELSGAFSVVVPASSASSLSAD
ncbi:hypothetical protein AB1L88_25530 [Tautonia sp. JC769]|uniref:hypothetical protein n=1 Tax=Tautonia sp. JC769 TaxID=3232135 RepID=UPI003458E402